MKHSWLFALACLLIPQPSAAQVSDMQRCVWSCLANFGPNTNPAYHQCVDLHCSGSQASPPASAQDRAATGAATGAATDGGRAGWTSGTQDGGLTAYAGADTDGGNKGFYYFCDAQGRSEILLVGLEGPSARLRILVDGRRYGVNFELTPEAWHVGRIRRDGPLLAALQRGNRVAVRNTSASLLMRLPLNGSQRAIGAALAQCR